MEIAEAGFYWPGVHLQLTGKISLWNDL